MFGQEIQFNLMQKLKQGALRYLTLLVCCASLFSTPKPYFHRQYNSDGTRRGYESQFCYGYQIQIQRTSHLSNTYGQMNHSAGYCQKVLTSAPWKIKNRCQSKCLMIQSAALKYTAIPSFNKKGNLWFSFVRHRIYASELVSKHVQRVHACSFGVDLQDKSSCSDLVRAPS